jgi:hypothetical protein
MRAWLVRDPSIDGMRLVTVSDDMASFIQPASSGDAHAPKHRISRAGPETGFEVTLTHAIGSEDAQCSRSHASGESDRTRVPRRPPSATVRAVFTARRHVPAATSA